MKLLRYLIPLLLLAGKANALSIYQNGVGKAQLTVATPFQIGGSTATNGNLVVNSTGTYILGDKSGDNAPTGYVGEIISTRPTTAPNAGATNVYASLSTTTLTAGVWMVSGMAVVDAGATTTQVIGCISTSANACANSTGSLLYENAETLNVASNFAVLPIGPAFINVTVNTPLYLTGKLVITSGTSTWDSNSWLVAYRIR